MAAKADTKRLQQSQQRDASALRRDGKTKVVEPHSALEQQADAESKILLRKTTSSGSVTDGFADLKRAAQARYGREVSAITLSISNTSQNMAESLSARGVTEGSTIHLSTRMHTGSSEAVQTVAHEMVHAVQQTGGATGDAPIASAPPTPALLRDQALGEQFFAVKLNRLNYLLSYRILDWAITDAEASEAIELLESMNGTERATALGSIRVDRLRGNLPRQAQIDQLDIMLKQTEGMRTSVQDINALLDTHIFDWAVTDAEANEAINRLKQLPLPQRHHAVMGINRRVLMQNLGPVEQSAFEQMWAAAQSWWNRQRQQHNPLNPGDEIRIRVYNAMSGDFLNQYFHPEFTYQVSANDTVRLPLLGDVATRGQRADDLAARISDALYTGDFLHKSVVSVEVVRRGSEIFEAQDFPFKDSQPTEALQPNDTFELVVIESPGLVEQTDFSLGYRIDPGGTVELPYIGRIEAAGITRDELTVSLHQYFSGWFRQPPTIWVWVRTHGRTAYRPPAAGERPQVASQHSTREWLAKQKPLRLPKRYPVDIYLEFYRGKNAELQSDNLSAQQKRVGQQALFRFMEWVSNNASDPDTLNATHPITVYGNIHTPMLIGDIKKQSRERVQREHREQELAERDAAVKAKLDEYWSWATARWSEASVQFRSAGPAHLITEHPYRKIGMNALTEAVLSWAHANTDHPEFARLSPNEVAVILMEEDQRLATLVDIGNNATPRLEYFPELDRTRRTLGDTALELFVGILPVLGEIQDASDLLTGVSITGEQLGTGDRLLAGFALIIPFVPGSAFRSGDELADVVGELSKATGRSIDEIEDMFRVAGNLDKADARNIERIMESVSQNKKLTDADLDILDGIATKLRGPLEELAAARKAGGKLPVKPLRLDPITEARLVPGSEAHMAQRWIEYQVRHGEKYSRLTSRIDPNWQRLYETIIANKRAGGQFETDVINWLTSGHLAGIRKNNGLMISSAADAKGFIPDGVKGNPGELIWGNAYHFVEVKGWAKMSQTGNLKAMIEYVDEFGGHIEVVFRSSKHADGPTKLTGPLEDTLNNLIAQGKATIRRYP